MNPQIFYPIIVESLDVLDKSNVAPAELIQRQSDHHLMGFGLWFRNRFCYGVERHKEIQNYFECADKASAYFMNLIGTHGKISESEWHAILIAEDPISTDSNV